MEKHNAPPFHKVLINTWFGRRIQANPKVFSIHTDFHSFALWKKYAACLAIRQRKWGASECFQKTGASSFLICGALDV